MKVHAKKKLAFLRRILFRKADSRARRLLQNPDCALVINESSCWRMRRRSTTVDPQLIELVWFDIRLEERNR